MAKLDITGLESALTTLKDGYELLKQSDGCDARTTAAFSDACVQRFEYTLDAAWKVMKRYLQTFYGKPQNELTVNNIFRLMEGYGLIADHQTWSDFYQRRNATSHSYDLGAARDVIVLIPSFLEQMDVFLSRIKPLLKEPSHD